MDTRLVKPQKCCQQPELTYCPMPCRKARALSQARPHSAELLKAKARRGNFVYPLGPSPLVQLVQLLLLTGFLLANFFPLLKNKRYKKMTGRNNPFVHSVVFCLITIPPSCSIFSIKFKCHVIERFDSHKHQTPLYRFVCINAATKTQNLENLHH